MNTYSLIRLGFTIVASNTDELILSKTYKNGKTLNVSCDIITTVINQVFKR